MERPKSGMLGVVEVMGPEVLKHFRTAESSGGLSSPSPFPENWKKEKVCFLCQDKLGTGRNDTKKRRGCKFCLHAVCEKCSPIKTMHPLTNKEERICVSCFKGMLERGLREEISAEVARKNQELRSLEEQLSVEIDARTQAEKLNHQLEKEIEQLRSQGSTDIRVQLEAEIQRSESIEKAYATLQTEHFRIQQEVKFEKQNFETSVLTEKQNADKMRKVLIFKTAELQGARSTMEHLRKQVEDLEKQLAGEAGREDVLKRTKEAHAAEKLDLQKQLFSANETLKEKLKEIDRISALLKEAQDSTQQSTKHQQTRESEAITKLAQYEAEIRSLNERIAIMRTSSSSQDSDLRNQVESLHDEVESLSAQLKEREALLALAKHDLQRESTNRQSLEGQLQRRSHRSDLDADMDLLKSELAKRIEQWKLFQEEVRVVLVNSQEAEKRLRKQLIEKTDVGDLGVREFVEKHRMELEQYKTQLANCHQTINKFDEVFRVVQEKLQLEQQVLTDKEREVEALKQLLENHGISIPTLSADQETGTDLTIKLKEREETIERLNAQMKEYKEEMKKLKNDKFRRSRPSANVQRNSTPKPPLSQDPCDCEVF